MATGNYIPTIHSNAGIIKFNTSDITFDESTAFSGETYANTIIACTDITITPPQGEVELVNLLGQESTTVGAGIPTTGQFQNAIFDEKSFTEAKMSATLIFCSDQTNLPDFLQFAAGAGKSVVTNTYKRHTFGDSTSGQVRVTAGAIILDYSNGSEMGSILMNHPYVWVGDIKPTGTDGYYEISFEARCLPKDFAMDTLV